MCTNLVISFPFFKKKMCTNLVEDNKYKYVAKKPNPMTTFPPLNQFLYAPKQTQVGMVKIHESKI